MTGRLDPAFDVKSPSGSTLLKYIRTIRHLRLSQIAWQLRNRLLPKNNSSQVVGDICIRTDIHIQPFCSVVAPDVDPSAIMFLNRSRSLDIDVMDWVCAEESKLWRYNLHYFDYLHWDSYSREVKTGLIDCWIDRNPIGAADAWEPYPVSLRVVNWIKYFLNRGRSERVSPVWQRSLALQTLWLEKNLEYHLRGNHLMKNAKALIFSGVYFSGKMGNRHLELGIRMMLAQVNEQMLDDGGHFERSPMYHCICLEDLLDVVSILAENPKLSNSQDVNLLKESASGGLDFLKSIVCGDGKIPLFNDAAFGISITPSELVAYGARVLNQDASELSGRRRRVSLGDSGIYGYHQNGDSLLIDCGPIGPSYQPGHAHCDTLSYELCMNGRRVIVDSGIHDYETGKLRQFLRSTAAHNTVRVDGEEQSEIWGAFRVARRGMPVYADLGDWQNGSIQFKGAHDGYCRLPGRPVHERQVTIESKGCWILSDRVTGNGAHLVESFIHIHPDIELVSVGARAYEIKHGASQLGRLEVQAGCEIRVATGIYCPEFGKKVENTVVVLSTRGDLPISMSYTIEKV